MHGSTQSPRDLPNLTNFKQFCQGKVEYWKRNALAVSLFPTCMVQVARCYIQIYVKTYKAGGLEKQLSD